MNGEAAPRQTGRQTRLALSRQPAIRIVATAGPGEGRGHLSRAIALAESIHDLGGTIELVLARGTLTALEAARLTSVGGPATDVDPAVTVVDLPDSNEASAWMRGTGRLVVFDDRIGSPARAPGGRTGTSSSTEPATG